MHAKVLLRASWFFMAYESWRQELLVPVLDMEWTSLTPSDVRLEEIKGHRIGAVLKGCHVVSLDCQTRLLIFFLSHKNAQFK